MSKEERISRRIFEICHSVDKIERYTKSLTTEMFLEDEEMQDKILIPFVVIGEASYKIWKRYPEFVKMYDSIQWREMSDFRNIIAHDYFTVNPSMVWMTIQESIPVLKKELINILDNDSLLKDQILEEMELLNKKIFWLTKDKPYYSPCM